VYGVAHQRDAHRAPVQDQVGQLVVMETGQPCPQADVGRVGGLGLHADKVLNRLDDGQLPAAQ
jgi:hypothetical protein